MDLLKTLLFYMIMTTSGATLEANVTPIPYEQLHTPTPYVTATPSPTPSPEPTATPAPTLPPVTLYEGRLGTHVRMLQQLLYDLGYLSAEPDGIYGEMTKEAVQTFQQRNSLEDDGIAGPKTIEKLYEAEVVLGPRFDTPAPTATPTPTPTPTFTPSPTPTATPSPTPSPEPTTAPTSTPTPTAEPFVSQTTPVPTATLTVAPTATPTLPPSSVDVSVIYVCEQETIISMVLTLESGVTPISPAAALVPSGYVLTSNDPIEVTVDNDGTANPSTVIFTLNRADFTTTVPVEYRFDGSLILSYTLDVVPGVTLVYPDSSLLPMGYVLTDPGAVTAPNAGKSIVFNLSRAATYYIDVIYENEQGQPLARELRMIYTGENILSPQPSLLPAGYTLDSNQAVTVMVDENGVCTPSLITFICQSTAN